ncbi:MAG: L-rhamnose mutarotase [Saprospiraceae bacterium]|nr:L-rhamnose mutarotase [Saprospiraceae bacterium]
MNTRRYCLALDLQDDPKLIAQYKKYHEKIWPEITDSIKSSGIIHMEIYHVADRLLMVMEVDDLFSFEKKTEMDKQNSKVQEWETLMDRFQKRLPGTPPGGKWVLMEKIFDLAQNG